MKRFPLILLVWLGCTLAWVILGTSLVARTGEWSSTLRSEVYRLWGPPLEQKRPDAFYRVQRRMVVVAPENRARAGETPKPVEQLVEDSVPIPLEASAIDVRLALEQRRKGLLWFPTYAVDFEGRFTFENPSASETPVEMRFPLSADNTVYDGFEVRDERGRAADVTIRSATAQWSETFGPRERRAFVVRYRSRGTSSWKYLLTEGTGEVKNLHFTVSTDFPNVDFPPGSLSPSRHSRQARGWRGEWAFENLVANAPIGIVMPERLNPGPLASKITFFAPVGLLFFFFVVAILASARRREIHPMNYFFLGCAFFAFHLLFAYLVDHLSILPSFSIASLTSILLVVSYARLFTGWEFALRQMGLAQLLYLVLFSYTFFWQGFTGLAITIGAILTLFVMMQYTGRTDWSQPQLGRAAQPA